MGIEAVQRVREGLAELIRLANDAATPTSELRELLSECKTFGGQVTVLQADTAAGVATRERHGDSGIGVLAQAAGLSRREAAGQVQTAERLQSMPAVRDAVETGRISVANAKTLARASATTSVDQVDGDAELLAKAAEWSVEQFTKEAGRWTVKRQADGGESEYRRQRARRRLSFWDGDDGMMHLRGELDPVTGAKVRKRFIQEAERLRRADLHSPGGDKRSLDQRMADALETLTSQGSIYSNADSAIPSGRGRSNGGAGRAGRDASVGSEAVDGDLCGDGVKCGTSSGMAEFDDFDGRDARASGNSGSSKCGCGRRPDADITIVQHLSADGTDAFAEIAGGDVIPQSVLEEHFCNSRIKGVVFSGEGVPLWHGHAKRLVTKTQMNALRARYGACGGCGADMWICQGHHIRPVSQGGATNIDNLMLACWACHQKIHHHGWREVPDGRGLYTIAPPEQIRYGPAHAPDPPPIHGPPPSRGSASPRPAVTAPTASNPGGSAEPDRPNGHQPQPLFTLA